MVFAGEPLVRVEGDLIEAQILETYLLTCLNLQTLVASKAARIVMAAQGRPVVDFGARRAHGPQAGLLAARGAIIGGCAGTSNVEAARLLGVPAVGTMAHSWIMAFGDEAEAFRAFQEVFPGHTTCLIDTYDTLRGAEVAARTLGPRLQGVRLDSGDLLDLSRQVRRILDENGCRQAKITASSDLNEFAITDLLAAGAPIDAFGVGTDMVTSRDAPALSVVYKMVARQEAGGQWRAVVKRSQDKATLGGRKQVWRHYGADGLADHDVMGLADERLAGRAAAAAVHRRRAAGGGPAEGAADCGAGQAADCGTAPGRELRGGYAYAVQVSERLRAEQPRRADRGSSGPSMAVTAMVLQRSRLRHEAPGSHAAGESWMGKPPAAPRHMGMQPGGQPANRNVRAGHLAVPSPVVSTGERAPSTGPARGGSGRPAPPLRAARGSSG